MSTALCRKCCSRLLIGTVSRCSLPRPAQRDPAGRLGSTMYAATRCVPLWVSEHRFEGICLYPITAYPGWDNSRHAEVGLFSAIHPNGTRRLRQPVADELVNQQDLFTANRTR